MFDSMKAKFQRNIKSGESFDSLIPPARNIEIPMKKDASVEDTIEGLKEIVKDTLFQTEKLAKVLKGKTLEETCKRIWGFVYWHIQYVEDKKFIEQLREPARLWADRGGDCDCYTVMISSILTNLNIPHILRITKYEKPAGQIPNWQHIYPIVPIDGNVKGKHYFNYQKPSYITIDCVPDKYDYEVEYLEKKDYPMELMRLAGLGNTTEASEMKSLRGLVEDEAVFNGLAEISEEEGYTLASLIEEFGHCTREEIGILQGLLGDCCATVEELASLTDEYTIAELGELNNLAESTGDELCELTGLDEEELMEVRRIDKIESLGAIYTNEFNSPNIVSNKIIDDGIVLGIDNKGGSWILKSFNYKAHTSDWIPYSTIALANAKEGIAFGELGKGKGKARRQAKKAVRQEKRAVKKEEKKVFKAARKEYKAEKKAIKKSDMTKSQKKAAKQNLRVDKPKTKVGKAIKKVSKVVNKLNPATILIRNGILAAMKTNMSKVASKLRFGYLSPEKAAEIGIDPEVHRNLVNQVKLKESSFESLGGKKGNLKKAILNGKGNKDDKKVLGTIDATDEEGDNVVYGYADMSLLKYNDSFSGLGEPATAATGAALAAAAATVAKWLTDIKKSTGDNIFPENKDANAEFNEDESSQEKENSVSDFLKESSSFINTSSIPNTVIRNASGLDPNQLIQKATGDVYSNVSDSQDSGTQQNQNQGTQQNSPQQNDNQPQSQGMSTTTKFIIGGVGVLAVGGIITAVVLATKKKSLNGLEGVDEEEEIEGLGKPKSKSKPKSTKQKTLTNKKVGIIKI